MKKSAWRLAVSALLLAVWICYLAYLAATTTQPIVLSRPQFLSADFYVVAELAADPADKEKAASEVKIKQVLWSANPDDAKRTSIKVINLGTVDWRQGWEGPGEYILALSRSMKADEFEVTPLPRTPGFPGGPGRIYPATSETLRQVEMLAKEYHR